MGSAVEDREQCKILAGAAAVSPDGSAESHSHQSPGGGNSINILHKAEKIGAGKYFKLNYNEIIVYGPASTLHPESVI